MWRRSLGGSTTVDHHTTCCGRVWGMSSADPTLSLTPEDFDFDGESTTLRRRADDALEAHLWLVDSHHRHPGAQTVVQTLLTPQDRPAVAPYINSITSDALGRASTWTMTGDMFREILVGVDFIADQLEDGQIDGMALTDDLVPADSGIVVFPYGVQLPHRDGGVTRTLDRNPFSPYRERVLDEGGGDRWMLDGFIWTKPDHPIGIGDDNGNVVEQRDGIALLPITRYRGRPTDRPFRTIHNDGGSTRPSDYPDWVCCDYTAWAYGSGITPDGHWCDNDQNPELVNSDEAVAATRLMRLLVWLSFRFFQDELPARERASRPVWRRAKPVLSERTPEQGDVVVFKLRHEHPADRGDGAEGAEPRWWRTRWMVSGHKALRRYAIRDANGKPVGPTRGPDAVLGVTYEYRTVTIAPYVKGPENMPLVVRNKVNVLAQ